MREKMLEKYLKLVLWLEKRYPVNEDHADKFVRFAEMAFNRWASAQKENKE